MGVAPGLADAMRGFAPVSGDCSGEMGELGEDDSSEDEDSETEYERPLRALIGMGLECSEARSALEVMARTLECFVARGWRRRRREE